MTAKAMAEVLAEHWSASTHTDQKPPVDKCDYCGAVLREWGDDTDMTTQLAAHQAAALSAAGFGPLTLVQIARRDRPEQMEAARAKVREERTASLRKQLREARAQALEDAAAWLHGEGDEDREEGTIGLWLRGRAKGERARAAAERGGE